MTHSTSSWRGLKSLLRNSRLACTCHSWSHLIPLLEIVTFHSINIWYWLPSSSIVLVLHVITLTERTITHMKLMLMVEHCRVLNGHTSIQILIIMNTIKSRSAISIKATHGHRNSHRFLLRVVSTLSIFFNV